MSHDIEYSNSTSDSIRQRVLYWSPRVILGFIVACAVFYAEEIMDYLANIQ